MIQGQSISYTDRDVKTEPEQLSLPFNPPLIRNSKQIEFEADERFSNFSKVLYGKDISIEDKKKIITTLLDNYKTGTEYFALRSKSLLLELYTHLMAK